MSILSHRLIIILRIAQIKPILSVLCSSITSLILWITFWNILLIIPRIKLILHIVLLINWYVICKLPPLLYRTVHLSKLIFNDHYYLPKWSPLANPRHYDNDVTDLAQKAAEEALTKFIINYFTLLFVFFFANFMKSLYAQTTHNLVPSPGVYISLLRVVSSVYAKFTRWKFTI